MWWSILFRPIGYRIFLLSLVIKLSAVISILMFAFYLVYKKFTLRPNVENYSVTRYIDGRRLDHRQVHKSMINK